MELASSRALEYAGDVIRRRWQEFASRFVDLYTHFGHRAHCFSH